MKIDLRGNIKTIGRLFVTATWNRQHGRRMAQHLVTVETEEPWRRGTGWGILVVPRLIIGVGRWAPDENPNMEYEAREAMEQLSNIPEWHHIGTLHEEQQHDEDGLPAGWTLVTLEERADLEDPATDPDASGPGTVLVG